MAILLTPDTRVLVQGMTGREGSFHTGQMRLMGTQVVAGVTPGKGGGDHDGVPIYDTVQDAVAATGANAAGIFVPPPYAADAIMEAAAAGLELIVCMTEGIPIQDMIRVKSFLSDFPRAHLLGPNCPGLLTPGVGKIGIIPQRFSAPGSIGIVARSGTLTYETMAALTAAGKGQSTVVGIGGDPINGMSFVDVLELFEADSNTTHVAVIGEIGGSDEERAAEYMGRGSRLRAVAFISGRTAPEGKRMGHAGAIVSGNRGTAQSKEAAFRAAGIEVAETTDQIVELLTAS
ncbi:MAG TPA: succinate--CoA ligase subunit alpha [Candidatus Nitrosotalea sp.]|nr:succinate--CoA ligase subunit alpha [Candidatus Nitrosotalea sp.]